MLNFYLLPQGTIYCIIIYYANTVMGTQDYYAFLKLKFSPNLWIITFQLIWWRTICFRRREVYRKKAAQFMREGKRSEARDCLTKCIDITSAMALELMNVSIVLTSHVNLRCDSCCSVQEFGCGRRTWHQWCLFSTTDVSSYSHMISFTAVVWERRVRVLDVTFHLRPLCFV